MLKLDLRLLLLSIVCCETHFQVHLEIPHYVLFKKNVTLRCKHEVPFNHIHKIEWLKGDRKLFRYIKGRNPPFYNYTIPGGEINWDLTNQSQLALQDVQLAASGVYSCSVTTETPIYTKFSDERPLVVVQLQTENPKITFKKKKYFVGEWLEVNCTSGYGHPVPELTWLMNGDEVKGYWIRSFPEQNTQASMIQISFQIKDEHNSGFLLECLSTIPGFMGKHVHPSQYADRRSDSIRIDILSEGFLQNKSSSMAHSYLLILIFLNMIHLT